MKAIAPLLIFASVIVASIAVAEPQVGHEQSYRPREAAPSLRESVASEQSIRNPQEDWPSPVDDETTHTYFLSEILEHRWNSGDDEARWDMFGWHGGDYNRLWIKSEGSAATEKTSGQGDLQLLFGQMISRYFDFQVGLRYEQLWDSEGSDHSRGFGAIGFQGLAPYYFDIEPTLFVSQDGDVSGRFTATYDIFFSQRLILQPRIEGNAAVREEEDFGVGSGLNDVEAGLRMRYELLREFAPYVGLNYGRRFGGTADLARSDGEDSSTWSLVSGLRLWF